jgi:hypothetical protein
MHVLGLYNLVVALGVAGVCSVCAPVATHDHVGFGNGVGRLNGGAVGGYWADFQYRAATPDRRAYFPSTQERDAAPRRDRHDPTAE